MRMGSAVWGVESVDNHASRPTPHSPLFSRWLGRNRTADADFQFCGRNAHRVVGSCKRDLANHIVGAIQEFGLRFAAAAMPVASAPVSVASAPVPVASAPVPVASAPVPVASAAVPVASAAVPMTCGAGA